MPFFIKKTEEENPTEEIIKELKTDETEKQPIQPKFTLKELSQLPRGTITIKIFVSNLEFAQFTLIPEIFNDAKNLIRETVSRIQEAQLKINSNCDCVWCKEKITELEEFLKSQ